MIGVLKFEVKSKHSHSFLYINRCVPAERAETLLILFQRRRVSAGLSRSLIGWRRLSVCLDPRFPPTFAFCVFFFFFFFFHAFWQNAVTVHYCSMNSNRKCWLFCRKQCIMYCSWTHKFYFLATFSLKMGPTVLFTHLKIILLQWFQQ